MVVGGGLFFGIMPKVELNQMHDFTFSSLPAATTAIHTLKPHFGKTAQQNDV